MRNKANNAVLSHLKKQKSLKTEQHDLKKISRACCIKNKPFRWNCICGPCFICIKISTNTKEPWNNCGPKELLKKNTNKQSGVLSCKMMTVAMLATQGTTMSLWCWPIISPNNDLHNTACIWPISLLLLLLLSFFYCYYHVVGMLYCMHSIDYSDYFHMELISSAHARRANSQLVRISSTITL